ncbi:PASTA domain-containing protein [Streptomyces sp. MST-110588]|uniref:Stk1 family PASTA domain-containing Ser/Thr kinase n=1 Tax=Streptomyces sp. MST-110588 TaxID=2833628 RepID=UPI001F5D8608|nr:PASTA domain-containing protein [Streptomyces sp. MST-110588]UNO42558.1 PASTA domain-containing protein [Streptomyces sp. MST-110588]
MDTTLQDPLVGQLLDGRYRVQARVAAGGMATVYRAVDTRLDRVLALKVMHPALATDEAFVERFIREAKSVARLSHPNVVGVFDQGTDGTYVYLAMEYVAGCTLRDVLRERGALQPRAALDVLEPILAALGAAHLAGLVHRDMKPENVLIGDDGRVKVADFGLVRAVDTHTTASTGSVLGTVSYLAPEQIEYGTADTRADVYACGVVLFEMLTGGKPHTGGSPAQVLYQRLHEDVRPPSQAVPGLAPQLDDLVAAATARDPQQRPQDAVTLLALVRAARAELSEEHLDAVPPQAKEPAPEASATGPEDPTQSRIQDLSQSLGQGPGGNLARGVGRADHGQDSSQDITSVLPRGSAPQQPQQPQQPLPAEEQLNRTSRLELPPAVAPAGPPPEHTARLRPAVSTGPVGAAGPAGPGGPGRRTGFLAARRKLIAVLIAVLAVFGVGAGVWYISSGQFTTVPAVLDMPREKAEKTLRDEGLQVEVEHAFSPNVARGHVMSTKPGTGKRIRGTGTVTIVLSRGPEIVRIPDLEGTPAADARRKLKDAGFVLGTETQEFSDEVAKGSVIRTDPPGGSKRRPDTAVALTVSRGAKVQVPKVTGSAQADAEAALRAAGFQVKIAEEPVFAPQDKGTVARQSPDPGTDGAKGDTLTLTLSKGPEMVTVPDVTDKNVDDAKRELMAAGFAVEVKKPWLFPQDSVDTQSVKGGDRAPKGSTITIRLKGAL